mgnify:CR=1 FL=1
MSCWCECQQKMLPTGQEQECGGCGPDEPYDDEPIELCPTCRGVGTVSPLTAPLGFFCAVVTECPICNGTGEAP